MKMMKNIMALALAFTFVFVGANVASASPGALDETLETKDQCTDCHTNMDQKYDHSNNDGTWSAECEYCHSIDDYDGTNGYYTDDETKDDDQGDGVSDVPLGYHGYHPEGECYQCHESQVVEPENHGGSLDCGNCHGVDTAHAPASETETPSAFDPKVTDSDEDGLTDWDETKIYLTSPTRADHDLDGLNDGLEVELGLDPTLQDSDADGTNDGDEDADADGLTNALEVEAGTDLSDNDTDNDGLFDGVDASPTVKDAATADAEIEKITLEEGVLEISGDLVGYDATFGTPVVFEDAEFGTITFDVASGKWTYTQDVFTIAAQAAENVTKVDSFTIQYPNASGELVAQTVEVTVEVTETTPPPGDNPPGDNPPGDNPPGTNPETGGTAGLALSVAVTTVSAAGLVVTKKRK